MSQVIEPPGIDEIKAAETRLSGLALRTPLIRLNYPATSREIYLKLECLQPIGVFKIRGIGNILKSTDPEKLRHGIYTASSGNSGYAVAWLARRLGIPATVYMPENAPEGKTASIRNTGATIKFLSYEDWWNVICTHGFPGEKSLFIDAVCNQAAVAGNATIGLEILQDLPEVNTIIIPFGGGGVSCGVASAIHALKPDTRILASESTMATPLASALEAGEIVTVEHKPSFISGIGSTSVLPEMWPMVQQLLDGSVVVPLSEVADAVRILFEHNRVVVEGASATTLAAALVTEANGPIVCVITGGNIDKSHMVSILEGRIPDYS